ncbi:hypothetical protein [Motilibacter deserti]|uniref:Cadherin domain-containing protein n=1 Tax=Motilibacter deserti TaxID=2714956 RepID=A0ABX0GQE5_9ACTN|nr:hypothetical protein [Motilibacter deserti]NHC12937.1 hypothetical protein [Motilibacter deserti]
MALFTMLLKVEEDEARVRYRFGPTEDNLGLLELDKESGEVTQLQSPDSDPPGVDFSNARKRLAKILNSGSAFPDRTSYAA